MKVLMLEEVKAYKDKLKKEINEIIEKRFEEINIWDSDVD